MKHRALLLALIALHVALASALHGGFDLDNDAAAYGRISSELASGAFVLSPHPFSNRFGLTVPTALVYSVLGVGRYTTTLWPLFASAASVVLVHALVRRRFGTPAGLLAAAFLALDPTQIRYASRPLPDIVVSAFVLAAVCCADRVRQAPNGETGQSRARSEGRHGVLTALAMTFALLTKSTVVWAVPFFLGLMALDLARGQRRRFWLATSATAAACGIVFLGVYHAATGDALYRFRGIESTHNAAPWTFADSGTAELLRRVTYQPLAFLLETPGYGPLFCLSLPALTGLALRRAFAPAGARFLAAWLAVVLGSFWVGSTSWSSYNPLPIAERFLMPVLPPLAAVAAVVVSALATRPGTTRTSERAPRDLAAPLLALAFLAAALFLARDGVLRALLYGLFLALVPWLARARAGAAWKCAAAGLLFSLGAASAVLRPETPRDDLASEARFLAAHLRPGERTLVLSDAHSTYVLPMYLDADPRRDVRFADWNRLEPEDGAGFARVLAYVHEPRLSAYYLHWGGECPRFAKEPPPEWERVASETLIAHLGRKLYELEGVQSALTHR